MQFVNVAPRVLLRASDLPATGLIAPGSRIGYALLVAGRPRPCPATPAGWARTSARPEAGDAGIGPPEVRRTLDRAQRFLSLVALLAVLISAVAVALAGRYGAHRDGIAVMRCLGAVQSQVSRMLTLEFALVGLFSSAVGCLLGFAVHQGLVAVLASLIDTTLPAPSAVPAAQGLLTGLLLLRAGLPSLAAAPAAGVLRRDADTLARAAPPATGWARRASRAADGGSPATRGWAGGVPPGAFLVFALVAWLCILGLSSVAWQRAVPPLRPGRRGAAPRRHHHPGLRAGDRPDGAAAAGHDAHRPDPGLAARTLPPDAPNRFPDQCAARAAPGVSDALARITQVCALAIGLMALLLLAMTRTDLIQGWQRTLPPDAPNRFLINVQPEQRQAVSDALAREGLGRVSLAPMVRGRLIALNGKPVGPDDYEEPRAKRLVDREFNLSRR